MNTAEPRPRVNHHHGLRPHARRRTPSPESQGVTPSPLPPSAAAQVPRPAAGLRGANGRRRQLVRGPIPRAVRHLPQDLRPRSDKSRQRRVNGAPTRGSRCAEVPAACRTTNGLSPNTRTRRSCASHVSSRRRPIPHARASATSAVVPGGRRRPPVATTLLPRGPTGPQSTAAAAARLTPSRFLLAPSKASSMDPSVQSPLTTCCADATVTASRRPMSRMAHKLASQSPQA